MTNSALIAAAKAKTDPSLLEVHLADRLEEACNELDRIERMHQPMIEDLGENKIVSMRERWRVA